jgi:hypothetical protein
MINVKLILRLKGCMEAIKILRDLGADSSLLAEIGIASTVSNIQWPCPTCTFENPEILGACQICQTPRPVNINSSLPIPAYLQHGPSSHVDGGQGGAQTTGKYIYIYSKVLLYPSDIFNVKGYRICPYCSYAHNNIAATSCEICQKRFVTESEWVCHNCPLINSLDSDSCGACGASRIFALPPNPPPFSSVVPSGRLFG